MFQKERSSDSVITLNSRDARVEMLSRKHMYTVCARMSSDTEQTKVLPYWRIIIVHDLWILHHCAQPTGGYFSYNTCMPSLVDHAVFFELYMFLRAHLQFKNMSQFT